MGKHWPCGTVPLAIGLVLLLAIALPVNHWQHPEEASDELTRFTASPATLAQIDRITEEIRDRGYGWVAGVTSVSYLSPAQFQTLLGARPPEGEGSTDAVRMLGEGLPREQPSDLPAHWDWRERSAITPARMQGVCGSCWAFCAAGALESLLRVYDARDLDLSEQHTIDCNTEGYGCGGGWMTAAYRVWRDRGARLESQIPYRGIDDGPCTGTDLEPVAWVDEWTAVPYEPVALKRMLRVGPLAVAMHVYSDFQHYRSGVYEHEGDDPINHAVLLIGWDDALQAWIMKNSWGTGWGENGCAYVRYGDCRLGSYAHVLSIPAAHPVWIHHTPVTDTLATEGLLPIEVTVAAVHAPLDWSGVRVYCRWNGEEGSWPLACRGGNERAAFFAGEFPELPVGSQVTYFLQARDTQGSVATFPADGLETPIAFRIMRRLLFDDLESPDGWIVGAEGDAATSGVWEWGEPEQTLGPTGKPAQPGSDHSPDGDFCFATGLAAGDDQNANDVDGGATTLQSARIDTRSLADVTLRFWFWFTNHYGTYPSEDPFVVLARVDETTPWTQIYATQAGSAQWRHVQVRLEEYLPIGSSLEIRFVATDMIHDSAVEALVDDVELWTATPVTTDVDEPPTPAPVGRVVDLHILSNPAHEAASLSLELATRGEVSAGVYDATGRSVRRLWSGTLPAGRNPLLWDGRNDRGERAPSGEYWVRVIAAQTTVTRRLTLIR